MSKPDLYKLATDGFLIFDLVFDTVSMNEPRVVESIQQAVDGLLIFAA